jgi:hypothetical protein
LLVGLAPSDDAAVYLVAPDTAIVETLDFFPPIVDDAYASGAIGAANAMSDVFAMGGEVLFALQIAAWPEDLSLDQLETLFRGGVDKVREAGGVVAGGHTVIDREPKYGLAVTGRVHPDHILRKNALRVGDALWLTKPIGTGRAYDGAQERHARSGRSSVSGRVDGGFEPTRGACGRRGRSACGDGCHRIRARRPCARDGRSVEGERPDPCRPRPASACGTRACKERELRRSGAEPSALP